MISRLGSAMMTAFLATATVAMGDHVASHVVKGSNWALSSTKYGGLRSLRRSDFGTVVSAFVNVDPTPSTQCISCASRRRLVSIVSKWDFLARGSARSGGVMTRRTLGEAITSARTPIRMLSGNSYGAVVRKAESKSTRRRNSVSQQSPESHGGQVAEPGTVYFVSTPIGNLEDITLRAMNILRSADLVASEDTRTTGRLLQLLGVERTGRLVSHHEHNLRRRVPEIVQAARNGQSVAVVSDAGTPGISDPGMQLAAECAAVGLKVVPVPGACAAVAALSVSGYPSGEFVFFGFISGKRGSAARARKVAEIAREPRSCVLYEAPHRIADTLRGLLEAACSSGGVAAIQGLGKGDGVGDGSGKVGVDAGIAPTTSGAVGNTSATAEGEISTSIAVVAGSRQVLVARELTKLHEEISRSTLAEAVARYSTDADNNLNHGQHEEVGVVRGEFTVVLGPLPKPAALDMELEDVNAVLLSRLSELTRKGMKTSAAVKVVAMDLGLKRSDVYRVAVKNLPSNADTQDEQQ